MYASLAGFLAVRNEQGLLEKVRGKLKELPPEELQIVGDQIMMATEPIFWELTDPMINFDYVDDEQKEALATIFDELTAQKPIVVRD